MATRLLARPNLVRPVLHQPFRTRPPLGPNRPFSTTNHPRSYLGRRTLWIAPLAGGIALYFVPRETSPIPALLSSPTIIPCHSKSPLVIESPAEPQRSIRSIIRSLLCDWIIEPVLTARRFVFLVIIFMPVILSSPMLLVGRPQKKLEGDRWGAIWWYKFLVRQMARAGPTFIKVRLEDILFFRADY
jgi:aarF domain-containing kinase